MWVDGGGKREGGDDGEREKRKGGLELSCTSKQQLVDQIQRFPDIQTFAHIPFGRAPLKGLQRV